MSFKPVSYLQTDKRWKNIKYAVAGENTTIGGSGCGPTAASMVVAEWANPGETPLTACNWSLEHGYKALNQGTYYAFFAPYFKRFGMECKQLNSSSLYGKTSAVEHLAAYNAIKQGDYVIACMGPGRWTSSGHFVLWYGINKDNVLINDPNSTASNRVKASWNYFKSQVKYYFVISRAGNLPKPVKTEDYTVTDPDGYLNIRYGAGTSYGVASSANAGAIVPVEKIVDGWARFVYNGTRYYVCASGLQKGRQTAKITTPEAAVKALVSKGVINTPDYWQEHIKDISYLDELIINMANTKTGVERKTYATAQQAISAMAAAGVINSPDYWLANNSPI